MSDLNPNPAVRMETARADFVRGVVRPDAPGMVYYPSIPELCATYDLEQSVMARKATEDGWLDERKKAMATSLVTPFSAAVDANPEIVKRADVVVREMEAFDDKVFGLARRAMAIADKAMQRMEEEADDDPVRAIRALRSLSQTMETFHRTAKTAYDPASVRPDNTVNINVTNVSAPDDVVVKVASILAGLEQKAIDAGVVIEGEILEDDE